MPLSAQVLDRTPLVLNTLAMTYGERLTIN
jgi:hypothetical protein